MLNYCLSQLLEELRRGALRGAVHQVEDYLHINRCTRVLQISRLTFFHAVLIGLAVVLLLLFGDALNAFVIVVLERGAGGGLLAL
ncbi:hypothetical protein K461DRAFT_278022, partial [Myriangium duriaei CBS 260.36]